MKKKIFLISCLFSFILSGCGMQYDITINDNNKMNNNAILFLDDDENEEFLLDENNLRYIYNGKVDNFHSYNLILNQNHNPLPASTTYQSKDAFISYSVFDDESYFEEIEDFGFSFFDLTVNLPSNITDTNGKLINNHTSKWDCFNTSFLYAFSGEQTIYTGKKYINNNMTAFIFSNVPNTKVIVNNIDLSSNAIKKDSCILFVLFSIKKVFMIYM